MDPHQVPIAEKIARLRHTNLLGGVGPDLLRALAQSAEAVAAEPGSAVVREGDIGDALFVVTRGLLRARRRMSDGRDAVLGDLNKGDFFGESALVEARPRNATVEAVTLSQLMRLSRDAIRLHLAAHPELAARARETLERRQIAPRQPFRPSVEAMQDALATLFAGVEPPALEALAREIEWLWLPAGETLLREGEPGDAVFFVLDGRLRVFIHDASGTPVNIGEARTGESIGEMALLSGSPRSASASAVLDTQLLRLSPEAFDELLADHPAIMAKFRSVMLARIAVRAQADALRGRAAARRAVTVEDCESVMRTRDLVIRNFKITHCYHRLALDLRELMGPQDVNWLAFGAHASKTAGYSVRKEDVPFHEIFDTIGRVKYLGSALRRATRAIGASLLARDADRILEQISQAVSDGNLRIFADMAPVVVRFLDLVRGDTAVDRPKMDAFRARLKPGPAEHDGQETLGLSLLAWYEAAHEPDPKMRAELVLLGNIRMGLHEQIRVQPDIEDALGAPLRLRVGDELGRGLDRWLGGIPKPLRYGVRRTADALEPLSLRVAAAALRRVITRRLMILRLPDQNMRMGIDLTAAPAHPLYPPELRELTHPELKALTERFEVGRNDNARGTGAVDWTSLAQRMNYIIHLFRSRQKNLEIFDAPLLAEQVAAIEADADWVRVRLGARREGP